MFLSWVKIELGQNQTFRSSQKYGFNNKYDMTCQSRHTSTYNISNNRLWIWKRKQKIPSIWASPHRKAELVKAALPKCWLPYYITKRTSLLPSWTVMVRKNRSTNSANATETLSSPRPNWAKSFMNACPATARNHTISSEASRKELFPMLWNTFAKWRRHRNWLSLIFPAMPLQAPWWNCPLRWTISFPR